MVLSQVAKAPLGSQAFDFKLKGTDDQYYDLKSCAGPNGLLVMFICNHCPYVKAIRSRLVSTVSTLQELGIGCVAINSNDAQAYPLDSFENMKQEVLQFNYNFPYLYDETQSVAKAYGAVCTPDFFGYNKSLQLQYRGRLDAAGKNAIGPDTKPELLEAMRLIAATQKGPDEQFPAIGCSIKWY